MNFNRETDHTPPVQPDLSPLASLGCSIQARADWNRCALSPWVQRQLESPQPGRSAGARSFMLIRPPVHAMMVGQLQRTTEETLVSRPRIGSVNPLLVENFTQEVAGRHAQQVEPKYQPQTSDTWANTPADLTWSGLTKAEEMQAQLPVPAPLPFTVDQIRQAIERQQAGLPPLPITSSPTPPPAPTQTVQPKRETAFPFSVAEVRAALEQPHFAKAPEIKRPSIPPSSPRQRRWVEEVPPPAPGPSAPAVDQLESFTEPSPPQPARPQAAPPASPPVQRQVSRPRPPHLEPVWPSAEKSTVEPELEETAPPSLASRSETVSPPPEESRAQYPAAPETLLHTESQPADLPRRPDIEPSRPAERVEPPQAAAPAELGSEATSSSVQRQMSSRPRPPRSEPVWQTLDPTNLPSNQMAEFDQPESEPNEPFQGDEPARPPAPAATGSETAPPSAKPVIQRQPAFAAPFQPEPSSLEMPLRWPQTEPDEVAQVVETSSIAPSPSEGDTAQPPNKPTVQRQPAVEIPSRSEPRGDEVAQVVEPSETTVPSTSGNETAPPSVKPVVQRQSVFAAPPQPEPSSLEMPLRWPQTAPDEPTQVIKPSQADALAPAGSEAAAPLPGQPTFQHSPVEIPPQIRPASTLETPLRRPEPGSDETADLAETTPSITGREVTSSPRQPTIQRQLALEPQTEQPSSLEMPLRLPEIEPTKIIPPIEPSQAAAPGVAESPVPSSFSQPAAQRQPIPEPQRQAEPPSALEIPLRFPPAEPGKAAQSVEPSPAPAISQAVQRQPQGETPPHRTESQPGESPQIPDLPQTKTLDGEWSGFDGPEEMLLRRVETDRVRPARQIGVLPHVRQPFEARAEGLPMEPEKTGEPALPLAQPLAVRPEAAARLDMPLAAPPQRVSKASEHREEPPSSASMPAMTIQRYWEPEAASSSSTAVDSEIGPIQRVEDTEISFSEEPETPAAELDLDNLARQVYPLVKRMLAVERDRRPFR